MLATQKDLFFDNATSNSDDIDLQCCAALDTVQGAPSRSAGHVTNVLLVNLHPVDSLT